jgi:hypothetical protein
MRAQLVRFGLKRKSRYRSRFGSALRDIDLLAASLPHPPLIITERSEVLTVRATHGSYLCDPAWYIVALLNSPTSSGWRASGRRAWRGQRLARVSSANCQDVDCHR